MKVFYDTPILPQHGAFAHKARILFARNDAGQPVYPRMRVYYVFFEPDETVTIPGPQWGAAPFVERFFVIDDPNEVRAARAACGAGLEVDELICTIGVVIV